VAEQELAAGGVIARPQVHENLVGRPLSQMLSGLLNDTAIHNKRMRGGLPTPSNRAARLCSFSSVTSKNSMSWVLS
jgi:hypothetical protein